MSIDDETLERIGEALTMLSCPYYKGEGICESGCHQEPACQVNEPTDGWESVILPGGAL